MSFIKGTHEVIVKTGDKKGAGVDANIFIILGDGKGYIKESRLDTLSHHDCKGGKIDTFYVKDGELQRVAEVTIKRDETGTGDAWYLEYIQVKCLAVGETSNFPIHRWIHANTEITLTEYDSRLPADDKYPDQRKKELEEKQKLYKLVQKKDGIPKQVDVVPEDEKFNADYEMWFGLTTKGLKQTVDAINQQHDEFDSLDDFAAIYAGTNLKEPEGKVDWKNDVQFGNQRMAGVNPAVIQLCQKVPENFAVADEMVSPFLEGKCLQTALESKKIYIVDYSYLENLECKDGKNIGAPIALFYVRDSGELVPIAIKLNPRPSADNPVFLPSDPEYTWLSAKMWFNLVDASVHQAGAHLGLTHLLMESVGVCANRQLSPSHPIFKLLAPHLLYIISINSTALITLVSPGGFIDQVMDMGQVGTFNIVRKLWSTWCLKDDGNLVNNLTKRGVDDAEALPNYPYRDDSLLLWNAINNYVTHVVNNIYDCPSKLESDTEIQSFAAELSSSDGAGIRGVVSKFSNNEELIEVLTVFIFISSVQHAAVNFGQYDEYGFSPNYPAIMRTERPKNKNVLSEEDIVKSLPTKSQQLTMIQVTNFLSQKATFSLGYFEMNYAQDPMSLAAISKFREELKEVGRIIDQRNAERTMKYNYLHPTLIPNAISI